MPGIKDTKKDTNGKPARFTAYLTQVTGGTVCEQAEEDCEKTSLTSCLGGEKLYLTWSFITYVFKTWYFTLQSLVASGARMLGFKSWLHHLLAVCLFNTSVASSVKWG